MILKCRNDKMLYLGTYGTHMQVESLCTSEGAGLPKTIFMEFSNFLISPREIETFCLHLSR